MSRRELLPRKIDDEPITMLPLLEIVGDRRVLIERHKGVLGYDKERICVKLAIGVVYVNGCNLEIIHMSKSQLVICGRILCVEYKRGVV